MVLKVRFASPLQPSHPATRLGVSGVRVGSVTLFIGIQRVYRYYILVLHSFREPLLLIERTVVRFDGPFMRHSAVLCLG